MPRPFLLALGMSACLLGMSACQPLADEPDPSDDSADLVDEVPPGQTSFGLELDLVNKFAYAMWSDGAFQANYDESLLDDELENDLAFLRDLNLWLDLDGRVDLPPVVDVTDRGFVISVGELHIDLVGGTDLGQLAATAVVAVEAEILFSIEEGILRMAPNFHEDDIHIDLKIASFAGLKGEAVERIVEGVAPGFVQSLLDRLETFPVPTMDLASTGINRVLGLQEATVGLSQDGAIMTGTLGDIDPSSVFETATVVRPPVEDTAPALAECLAPDPAAPGLEGDCCFSDGGRQGVCTNLDPDGDGVEESFCPSTGQVALRLKCPSAPNPVKCCIYP